MKFALIMQFSEHDAALMQRAVRLIVGLENEFNKDWDFVFSVKTGANLNNATAELAATRFKIHVFRGNRRSVGWPDGPNAQWCETALWAYTEKRAGKVDWDYVFTTEPDIVPLSPDWLKQLQAFAERANTPIMGVRHPDHINGNLFMKTEFAFENKLYGAPAGVAWDMHWAPLLVANAADCLLMKNLYKRTAITEAELYEPRSPGIVPVFVHGIKDNSGIEIVAKKHKIDLEKNPNIVRV